MAKGELVGPLSDAKIQESFNANRPTNNSSSGRWFVCKKDKETDRPVADYGGYGNRCRAFTNEVAPFLQEMRDECEVIAVYTPVRGSKKDGTRSQKDLREHAHAKFKHHLAEIAEKHDVSGGAWIVFLNADEIDNAMSVVFKSLASPTGALRAAGVTYAKASTSEQMSNGPPFTMWIFLENGTDVVSVETVFRVCVEQGGFSPTSFKTDAMSVLGLNSKDPSKIMVSTFTKTSFMTTAECKAAKEQYQRSGPARSIGPLSGPPVVSAFNLDFTYTPPVNNQPAVVANAQQTPKKGKKAAAAYVDPPSPPRAPREAAQKATDKLRAEAEEKEAHRAARIAAGVSPVKVEEGDAGNSSVDEKEDEEEDVEPKPLPLPANLPPRREGFDEEAEKERIKILEARLDDWERAQAGSSKGGGGKRGRGGGIKQEEGYGGGKKVKREY